jgi:hypothetical protein
MSTVDRSCPYKCSCLYDDHRCLDGWSSAAGTGTSAAFYNKSIMVRHQSLLPPAEGRRSTLAAPSIGFSRKHQIDCSPRQSNLLHALLYINRSYCSYTTLLFEYSPTRYYRIPQLLLSTTSRSRTPKSIKPSLSPLSHLQNACQRYQGWLCHRPRRPGTQQL